MQTMNVKEDELIVLAKQGNELAFEQILTNYKPLVTSLARRYFLVGGDVDDLISEAMIALYKSVQTFSKEKNVSFKNYAKILIERQIINAIKSANSQKNSPLNEYVALNHQGAVENETAGGKVLEFHVKSNLQSPERLVENETTVKELLKKIKQVLSEFEMNVLEKYINGSTYIQIATDLKTTTKSIDNALNRIKSKLKFLK